MCDGLNGEGVKPLKQKAVRICGRVKAGADASMEELKKRAARMARAGGLLWEKAAVEGAGEVGEASEAGAGEK